VRIDIDRSPSPGITDILSLTRIPVSIMTSTTIRPLIGLPIETPRRPAAARAAMSPWMWMAVTCLLLGISGGIRVWRDWQFATLAGKSEPAPFPLAELPRTLGTWQAGAGEDTQLDPGVARFAGASDHIVRGYLDEKTGEKASNLVLYGLAWKVFAHTPEACYPAAGYQLVKGPIDRSIAVPGVEGPVRYRWAIYMKRVGGISRYEESYYTFRHNGEWLPDVADRWKLFRYQPGLFKIQIQHPVSSLSENGEGPCESLLVENVRQISSRLSAAGRGPTGAPASTASGSRQETLD
jgi:Protein of unknown function (DUF3485)